MKTFTKWKEWKIGPFNPKLIYSHAFSVQHYRIAWNWLITQIEKHQVRVYVTTCNFYVAVAYGFINLGPRLITMHSEYLQEWQCVRFSDCKKKVMDLFCSWTLSLFANSKCKYTTSLQLTCRYVSQATNISSYDIISIFHSLMQLNVPRMWHKTVRNLIFRPLKGGILIMLCAVQYLASWTSACADLLEEIWFPFCLQLLYMGRLLEF